MLSKKLSRDDVFAEAGKYNITINLIHFETPEETEEKSDKKKKAGGRPPVKKSVVQINEDDHPVIDLYEELIKHNEIKQRNTLPLPNKEQVEEQLSVLVEKEEEEEDDDDVVETEILKNLVIEIEEEVTKPVAEIKDVNVEKKKPSNKKKSDTDKEQKEAEKKAEKERKEAEKKAEKERKEAEKKAEKEQKEAEKKTKQPSKKTEKVVQPKKVVVLEPTPIDDVSSVASSDVEEGNSAERKGAIDDCFSTIIKHIQYWVSYDTFLVYDDVSHKQVGRYDLKTKEVIFNTNDEELEEEEYIDEGFTNDNSYGDYYDDLDRADEEEYLLING